MPALFDGIDVVLGTVVAPLEHRLTQLMQPVDALFLPARSWAAATGASVGLPADMFSNLVALLAFYPIGQLWRLLPRSATTLKHILSILIGVSTLVFCFGAVASLHVVAMSGIALLLVRVLPGQLVGRALFFYSMGYLSLAHLYRQYTSYMAWNLDITGPLMILALKLGAFGYNFSDGQRKLRGLSITKDQEARSISALPSLLEYFGWVFFYPSMLAGPKLEIREYLDFVSMAIFDKNEHNKGECPSTLLPALKRLGAAAVVYPLHFVMTSKFPLAALLTPESAAWPFWWRCFHLMMCIRALPYKYQTGWFLGDGACISSGIGFVEWKKSEKSPNFDRCSNCNFWRMEKAQNLREIINNWNLGTVDFLKNYVYLRVTPEGQKPGFLASLAVYTTSAFWHGFYPGYYIFFITVAIGAEVAREMRTRFRPFVVTADGKEKYPLKYFYDIAGFLISWSAVTLCGGPFSALSLENSLKIMASNHYLYQLGAIAAFAFFSVLPKPRRSPAAAAAAAASGGAKPKAT